VIGLAVEGTSYAGDISLKAFLVYEKLSKNSEHKIKSLLYGGVIIIATAVSLLSLRGASYSRIIIILTLSRINPIIEKTVSSA
jgi:hypothetical protein